MYSVVLVLLKLQVILSLLIMNYLPNGYVRGKQAKEVLMVGHKNCQMCVTLGGFIQLSV